MVTVRSQFNEFPRDQALVTTTYDFDWDILDNMVALDHGRRKSSIVITDKGCFDKKIETLPDPQPPWLCNSYFLNPAIEIKGAFHPKVAMTVDSEDLLMVVGSHNLTRGGIESNLEVTGFARIPLTQPNLDILESVSDFLDQSAKHVTGLAKDELLDFASEIKNVEPGITKSGNFSFLHSFRRPIIDQIIEKIPDIEKTIVIAPTYSEDPRFIKEAQECLGKNLTIVVDPAHFSVGKEAKNIYETLQTQQIRSKPPRVLHAKIYIFQTKAGDWVLFGSPNFTRNALLLGAESGGNVEVACLIPPSSNWSWQQLFSEEVALQNINLAEIPAANEKPKETAHEAIVEHWGYESLDGKGTILAPTLKEGTIIFIHFLGTGQKVEAIVTNNRIEFSVPLNWKGIKYEILDSDGKLISIGILNRAKIIGSGYEDYHFDQDTIRELYHFMRRLHNTSIHNNFNDTNARDIDILILEENLRAKPIGREWNRYSGIFKELTPKQFYSEAQKELCRTAKNLQAGKANLRQLLNSLDLLLESTYLTSLLTDNRIEPLVLMSKDLSKYMNLPSGSDSQPFTSYNKAYWKPNIIGRLHEIDEWEKIEPTIGLELSLLFNYWVYYHTRGKYGLDRKNLDVVIVTNRYRIIWNAFKRLSPKEPIKSTYERIWESRLSVLSSKDAQVKGILPTPTAIDELKICLQSAIARL
jgi:HKD family nuclease